MPEFNAGAMENAGAVTFLEDYVFRSKVSRARYERRAETVLHELAHMWFGDLVTMRWWDDLWLNESFATYISTLCQAEATEYTTAWTTFANTEKAWAYAQDQLPSTHPIAADIPDVAAVEVNFDGITYAKGASVLKQLVAYVGRDEFLAGVRRYFRKHEYGNTTLADLLAPLSESSGRDLSEWVEQWLRTSQVNTLRPVFELTDDGRYASFAIEQTAVAEHPVLRNHRLAVGLYSEGPDGLTRSSRVELDVAGAAHRGARAGRAPGGRPRAGQRRRPHLRQAAPRRAVAGHAAHADRRHPRPAGPRAVLVGGLGHDPRRRAARPRVGAAGAGRRRRRDRDQRRPVAARPRADRAELLRRPVVGADRLDAAGRPRARRAGGAPRRAATCSCSGRARSPAPPAPTSTPPSCAACSTAPGRCEGLEVDADARWAFLLRAGRHRRGRRRRDRRRGGAGRHRHRCPPGGHARGPCARRRSRRRRPGSGPSTTTTCRTRCTRRCCWASGTRRSGSSPPTTSSGTSPRSGRCGTAVPARSPRTPSSTCSRRSSSRAPSWRPTPGWPTPSSRRRCAGWSLEGRDGIARALRARERDADVEPLTATTGRPRGTCRSAPAGRVDAVRSGALCSVRAAQGRRVAGLVGELPQPVDDAADEVTGGERAGHRQHGERAGAVGQPAGGGRAGDDLDHPLAGRDGDEHRLGRVGRRTGACISSAAMRVRLPRSPM